MTRERAEAAAKPGLHPRNKHRQHYDFNALIAISPALRQFVRLNAYQALSIDFSDAEAVKALNRALLTHYYAIDDWDIPAQYLCPPIPGRADYLHYLADLRIAGSTPVAQTALMHNTQVRVLDIGVGANAVYPLIGHREYGWQFVGTDIDATALANAQRIVDSNGLESAIRLRLQTCAGDVFQGIIEHGERFDLTICNPPFHASLQAAKAGNRRKSLGLHASSAHSTAKAANKGSHRQAGLMHDLHRRNLHGLNTGGLDVGRLNFGGHGAELYCDGGESGFIRRMVMQSRQFSSQCLWFTTLVSKSASLPGIYAALREVAAVKVHTIAMAQGQKKSRLVAWTFLNATQQGIWRGKQCNRPD